MWTMSSLCSSKICFPRSPLKSSMSSVGEKSLLRATLYRSGGTTYWSTTVLIDRSQVCESVVAQACKEIYLSDVFHLAPSMLIVSSSSHQAPRSHSWTNFVPFQRPNETTLRSCCISMKHKNLANTRFKPRGSESVGINSQHKSGLCLPFKASTKRVF